MARKAIVEIQCERCARKETQELGASDNTQAEQPPVFYSRMQVPGEKAAVEVKFADLCKPCTRAVQTLAEQIGKKIEGLSPDRGPAKVKEEPVVAEKPKKEEPASQTPAPRAQAAAKTPPTARSS